ncbi:MAG: hypothetical protein JO208_03330 [Alphaproteobacteria bacterium]|nr:hypothetical protein [Alphaproteobacteria bacterium]
MAREKAHHEIESPVIRQAVELATSGGNEISEVQHGWSKLREVIAMKFPLSDGTRERLFAMPALRYYPPFKSPHYVPDEGFICDDEKAAISFPCQAP